MVGAVLLAFQGLSDFLQDLPSYRIFLKFSSNSSLAHSCFSVQSFRVLLARLGLDFACTDCWQLRRLGRMRSALKERYFASTLRMPLLQPKRDFNFAATERR
jgi:hypothetical protein